MFSHQLFWSIECFLRIDILELQTDIKIRLYPKFAPDLGPFEVVSVLRASGVECGVPPSGRHIL